MENLKFRSFSVLALASVHNYFKYIQGIAWTPAAALTGTSPTRELLCCCDTEGVTSVAWDRMLSHQSPLSP